MFEKIKALFSSSPDKQFTSLQVSEGQIDPKAVYRESLKNSRTIIGAIAGDVIGSKYEWKNTKQTDFELFTKDTDFTDDTVLTIAVADCILNHKDFSDTIKAYGRKYPNRGYGSSFKSWLHTVESKPYNSWGNGSAMRVSAVGFACTSLGEVMEMAKNSAEVTHNHPEGIKGAQAIAASIFLAQNNRPKHDIKKYVIDHFDYDLNRKVEQIRPSYHFDVSCQGSVPEAIIAFMESTDYESAIRIAISLGGDSDTIACMAGGIAAAFYKNVPNHIINKVIDILPLEFLKIIHEFDSSFNER